MKKFFAILMFFVFIAPSYGELDYDLLYKDMPVLDYMYETGYDEDESSDYEDYIISPYVLVRLPVKLKNKNITLNQGYYLVKPERKDGYRFVVFKQNGVVKGAVPVFQKVWVDPEVIFPPPPKPKHKWYVQPFVFVGGIIKWPFNKLMEHRKPLAPPRAKADFRVSEDGNYYEMWLYVESSLYKMLFKLDK